MTPEYINELADTVDPSQVWRLPVNDQQKLPPFMRKALDAGVALRRHAEHVQRLRDLLGTGKSLLLTPISKNGTSVRIIATPTAPAPQPEPTDAQVALLDPWMRPAAARELLRQVLAAGRVPAPSARPDIPAGYALVPDHTGYAHLGTGGYAINVSDVGDPAEVIISIATAAERANRSVGERRDNPPGHVIQPEQMAVRLRFATAAGLDALEDMLRQLRAEHFPSSSVAPRPALDVEQMLRDCVPGGTSCDPQQVADAIRAWAATPEDPQ